MTKKSLGLIALLTSTVLAGALSAQTISVPAAAAAAPKQQKLIRVSTLNSIEGNQEFQKNVQLLQTQRQQAVEINAALEKETDAAKKKDLKGKLDELMKTLNDNNQKMVKAYGFSLERNYTLVPEVAHVYMFVTDEEAERHEKEQAAIAAKEKAAAAAAATKEKAGAKKK
ncbi:MAG: hypothetical protein RLZZ15_374 [Verrucomicrobiota bacterium]|jgi:hypothetical protein